MSKPKSKSRAAKPKAAPPKGVKHAKAAPKAASKPAPKPTPKLAPKSVPKPAPKVVPKAAAKPAAKAAPKAEIKAPLKTASKATPKADSSKSVLESAQHIWLAGLGAFGKAQQEGGKMFQALVNEGSALQGRTRKIATGAAGEMRGAVESSANQMREQAQESWGRLEQVFERQVSTALAKLNIPGRKEFEELTRRIEELSKDVRKTTIGTGVKTGFGNVMTTTVRRARDDLNDLARELEEAQLAAKQAEKKAPAKKK
jgi:poly(hydroxyalkanoate) granule-associated protein